MGHDIIIPFFNGTDVDSLNLTETNLLRNHLNSKALSTRAQALDEKDHRDIWKSKT